MALYLHSTPANDKIKPQVRSSVPIKLNKLLMNPFPLDSLGENRGKREIMSNKFDPWLFLSEWWSVSSRFSWVQRSRIEKGLLESHWHHIYVSNEFMVALAVDPPAAWFERSCDVWSFHWKIRPKPFFQRGWGAKIKLFINFSCHREKSLKTRESEREVKRAARKLEMRVHTKLSIQHSTKKVDDSIARRRGKQKTSCLLEILNIKLESMGMCAKLAAGGPVERDATTSFALCFPIRSSQVRIK